MTLLSKLNRRQFTLSSITAGIALLGAPAVALGQGDEAARAARPHLPLKMQVSAEAFASYLAFEIVFLNPDTRPQSLSQDISSSLQLSPERATLLMGAARFELETRPHHDDLMFPTSRLLRPNHLRVMPAGAAGHTTPYGRFISPWPEALLKARGDDARRVSLMLALTLRRYDEHAGTYDEATHTFEARAESLLLPRALRPYEHG